MAGSIVATFTMPVVAAIGAAGTGSPTFNPSGIVDWGVKNVIPLILLVIGLSIIAGARKGRMSENANTLTNVLIGSAVIGSAALIFAFATQMSSLLFGG